MPALTGKVEVLGVLLDPDDMTRGYVAGMFGENVMLRTHDGNQGAEESLSSRLKALVERAAKEAGASYAFLLLREQDTPELQNAAWYGRAETSEGLVAVARWALSRGGPICLQGEAEAKEIVGSSLDKSALPLICAPVMSNATPQGVLVMGSLQSAREEFSRWLPIVEFVASLAGAFLENAALQRDLHRRGEQVRDLIRDTLDAQEAERERVCLEVHDGVAQTLASAFQYLQTLETTSPEGTHARRLLLRASALVKQAIQESREVINSLQPATLRDLGLVATLRQEMRQLEQEKTWRVDFEADALRLATDIETGLYRIIREAITNVRRHADSSRLRIRITSARDRVVVEVRDWGIGFSYDPREVSRGGGTGLLSMRKRAELLQGTCEIQSNPGQGTAVCIEIPFSR